MHPPLLANELHVAFTVNVAEIVHLNLPVLLYDIHNSAFTDLLTAAMKIAHCHRRRAVIKFFTEENFLRTDIYRPVRAVNEDD